jgi:hypothetical protein
MQTQRNVKQIKDEVSLVEFLARLGHQPTHRSGRDIFYKSMLRNENTPSFCVNDHLDVWFDHGGPNLSGIKGGNIIDFGLAYWNPTTLPEVLNRINDIMSLSIKQISIDPDRHKRPRLKGTRVTNYIIQDIKELGNSPSIKKYLEKRGIWEQAQGKIKEVYYVIESGPKKGTTYFSAGWQNENGGWELRNRVGLFEFKACLDRKGISFVNGSSEKLAIFEGFLDYLSWLKDNPNSADSIIVLNSVNLLDIGIERAKTYRQISAYFDRDKAGETAFGLLKQTLAHAEDCSEAYTGFKDYNEMLLAKKTTILPWEEENIYEKILGTYKR